nr:hypothetical protein Iba_chr08aCG9770 [Ipomoea batatas]
MKVGQLPSPTWPGAPIIPAVGGIKQEIVEQKEVVNIDSLEKTIPSPFYQESGLIWAISPRSVKMINTMIRIPGRPKEIFEKIIRRNHRVDVEENSKKSKKQYKLHEDFLKTKD